MVFYDAHLSYLACDKRQSRRSIQEMAMRISLPLEVDRPGWGDVNFIILLLRGFCEFLCIFAGYLKWFLGFVLCSQGRVFTPERVVYWPLPISAINGKAVYKGLTTGYCQPRGLMAPQSFTVSRTPFMFIRKGSIYIVRLLMFTGEFLLKVSS